MIKVCTNCTAEYWARWRNEPVTLCPDCREDVILCAACGAMQRPPVDERQLALFPWHFGGARAPATHDATYVRPPTNASQKAKRNAPYH